MSDSVSDRMWHSYDLVADSSANRGQKLRTAHAGRQHLLIELVEDVIYQTFTVSTGSYMIDTRVTRDAVGRLFARPVSTPFANFRRFPRHASGSFSLETGV